MRILALATNPETGASTRFRVAQWQPHLTRAGFRLELDSFWSDRSASVLYRPGRALQKFGYGCASGLRRMLTLRSLHRRAEALLIHREAFPLGLRPCFGALERFGGPLIYDYDDAMFVAQRQGRGLLGRLEDLDTPRRLMARSDVVLAGNQWLADYARQHARDVVVLPTCIDTDWFRPRVRNDRRDRPVVGWIGSHSTAKYLLSLAPVLQAVAERVSFTMLVVGSPTLPRIRGVEVRAVGWNLKREAELFASCDVGIYPLWDDPWSRGKCGFKAIQFMACGVPVVAAAIGANRQIVQDGANGLLASTPEEWVEKLGRLLREEALRRTLGEAGRRTVEERYSTAGNAPVLIASLCRAMESRLRRGSAAVAPFERAASSITEPDAS